MNDIGEDITLTHDAVGTTVVYVDEIGVAHDALVTRVWNAPAKDSALKFESLNLVYVDTPDHKDQYGVQIKRATSVVPEVNQSAHGRFYRVK